MERPLPSPLSGEVSLRFRVALRALTPGPVELSSTFPSTSSNGRAESCVLHFGNLAGNVGKGNAEKYG